LLRENGRIWFGNIWKNTFTFFIATWEWCRSKAGRRETLVEACGMASGLFFLKRIENKDLQLFAEPLRKLSFDRKS
jgi:hypothetical protein